MNNEPPPGAPEEDDEDDDETEESACTDDDCECVGHEVAEFEREIMIERTVAGLAVARREGQAARPPARAERRTNKHKGSRLDVDAALALVEAGVSRRAAARQLGASDAAARARPRCVRNASAGSDRHPVILDARGGVGARGGNVRYRRTRRSPLARGERLGPLTRLLDEHVAAQYGVAEVIGAQSTGASTPASH